MNSNAVLIGLLRDSGGGGLQSPWDPTWSGGSVAYSDADYTAKNTADVLRAELGVTGHSSGLWYGEASLFGTNSNLFPFFGIGTASAPQGGFPGSSTTDTAIGGSNTSQVRWGFGGVWTNDSSLGGFTDPVANVGMVALNQTTGKVWFGFDGAWLSSGDPAAGTGAQITNTTYFRDDSGLTWFLYGGQRYIGDGATIHSEIIYTPPTGFSAWG